MEQGMEEKKEKEEEKTNANWWCIYIYIFSSLKPRIKWIEDGTKLKGKGMEEEQEEEEKEINPNRWCIYIYFFFKFETTNKE